jgi:CPA2 family monovalent cation:H+ antiporter-2
MLAQIGEFSFVLERAGREVGLFPIGMGAAGSQTFIATTVVLMVLTPVLMNIGSGLSAKIVRNRETSGVAAAEEGQLNLPELNLEDHVIVAGYGQAARCLVRVLSGSGIPYVITTLSPDGANEADESGLPVVRGDVTKPFLLHHVGIDNAKMMVIADDNPAMAHRITAVARSINPTMRIVVRTRYTAEVDALAEAGADSVIAEELESVVQLFGEVLRDYRIPATEIEAYEELARQNGYSALFDAAVDNSVFACKTGTDCFDSRTVKVREGAAVAGKSIHSLMLMEDFGLTVKSVTRGAELFEPPSPEFVLEVGDEIVISGETDAFARNAAFFRTANKAMAVSADAPAPVPARSFVAKPLVSEDENELSFKAETGIDTQTETTYVS